MGSQGAAQPRTDRTAGRRLGGEEALAIAVYCALATPDVETALLAAVNHSGDSDSTGAITGNIVGAMYGDLALPKDWVIAIEGRDLLLQLADDFAYGFARAHGLRGSDEVTTSGLHATPVSDDRGAFRGTTAALWVRGPCRG